MRYAKMSAHSVRIALLTIWFVSLGLNLAIVLYLGLDHWIGQENFHEALTQLNSSYLPYVGVIVAFYFAHTPAPEGTVNRNNVAAGLALVASVVWNLAILALFVPLLFGRGFIEQSIRNTGFVG